MRSSEQRGRLMRAMAALICLVLQAGAGAQQSEQQTAQALARAQGLLRQIGQQKQQLEVDNAKLQVERASLEKKLKKAELALEDRAADLASRERDNQRSAASLERTKARLDQTVAKLRAVIDRYKQTARSLQQTQMEKEELSSQLALTGSELKDAEAKNLALYQANREILALYKNKSGWKSVLQQEPVTGIVNVEVENLVEKYEYEMYDQLRDGNLDSAQALKQAQPLTGGE